MIRPVWGLHRHIRFVDSRHLEQMKLGSTNQNVVGLKPQVTCIAVGLSDHSVPEKKEEGCDEQGH